VALEIASSSIVANGACQKKKERKKAKKSNPGKGLKKRNKGRREPSAAAPHSLSRSSQAKGVSFVLGSFFLVFVSEGRREGKLLPGHGRMIFNELKPHLSCLLVGKRLSRKKLLPQKSPISIASKNHDVRSSETFNCLRM